MQWHQRYRRSVGSIVGGVFIIIMMIIFMWLAITTIDRIYSYTENILSKLEKQTKTYRFTSCIDAIYTHMPKYENSTQISTGNLITYNIAIYEDVNLAIYNRCPESVLITGIVIVYNYSYTYTYNVIAVVRIGRQTQTRLVYSSGPKNANGAGYMLLSKANTSILPYPLPAGGQLNISIIPFKIQETGSVRYTGPGNLQDAYVDVYIVSASTSMSIFISVVTSSGVVSVSTRSV
ncbi:hypothetical protein Igag_1659 [Ignisphaera aggregans DSM 17230]|uniref:Uncharacterized protein n=1 Tax=Ignisphaera aggregans (strain DSM 17230 / JCM 13409 / AQ1.S1) TaxID=583356 RepID=E0SRS6_IGNAA|nr:hypothetical protein Igag_1659 [Ignisphaera aggregans DSM 17230]